MLIGSLRFGCLVALLVGCVVGQGMATGVERERELQSSLDAFCEKWMSFLAQRERDNKDKIAWRAITEGVEGDFVGYDTKYQCRLSKLKPETKVPVGTIKYLEFKYRHKGTSSSEALTEIFRYSKNKWVY